MSTSSSDSNTSLKLLPGLPSLPHLVTSPLPYYINWEPISHPTPRSPSTPTDTDASTSSVWEAAAPLTPVLPSGPSCLSLHPHLLSPVLQPPQALEVPQTTHGPTTPPSVPSGCPALCCTSESKVLYGTSNPLHPETCSPSRLHAPHSRQLEAFGRHHAVPLPIMLLQTTQLPPLSRSPSSPPAGRVATWGPHT